MANDIAAGVTKVGELSGKIDALLTAMTSANSRFEAKLTSMQAQIDTLTAQVAAGSDTTPIIDAITPIETKVDNAKAAEDISGN